MDGHKQIARENQRRHNHWTEQTERCPYCGGFVSLNEYEHTAKGNCPKCGRAILRYNH